MLHVILTPWLFAPIQAEAPQSRPAYGIEQENS